MMERYQTSDQNSYILGISLIVEALLEMPEQVKEVFLSSKANKNKELDKLLELCKKYHIQISVNDKIIDKLSLKENCYGIGIFKKYAKELNSDKHLVLYGFKNEGELGTIIRSAVSFDFRDIVLINTDIDYFDPKVIRASMGSFFHTNIKKFNTLDDYLKTYKYNIYPFTGDENRELQTIKIKKPYSIIIPNDYHGLDKRFIESYYIKHRNADVSLTTKCSIIFNYFYHQNVICKNI